MWFAGVCSHLSRTDTEQDQVFYDAESCSLTQIVSVFTVLNFSWAVALQLTEVCSPVPRSILSVSAPVVAAVSFMDICFPYGLLFPRGNYFPTSQSSLSANWACVVFSVKHFEIHQC